MGPLTAVIEHSDKPHGLTGSQSEARFQGVLNGFAHDLKVKRHGVGILWQALPVSANLGKTSSMPSEDNSFRGTESTDV
jgi:hypothetical protein